MFRIHLTVVQEDFTSTFAHIDLVDLAGSESVNKTRAEGLVRKEGENINKSLLALSNVIRCMSERTSFVNYRDSKLTRILQSSLCNNSRSLIICTVKQTEDSLSETVNTLKFGVTASSIRISLNKNVVSER